jgi:putative transposase
MRKKGPHQALGLYAHLTWHTWYRRELVNSQGAPIVRTAIHAAAERTAIRVHAVAVLTEHVHVVVSYPPRARVSDFVREAKSESARRVNQDAGSQVLRWGRGYYVNSLSRGEVTARISYVATQYQKHPHLNPERSC